MSEETKNMVNDLLPKILAAVIITGIPFIIKAYYQVLDNTAMIKEHYEVTDKDHSMLVDTEDRVRDIEEEIHKLETHHVSTDKVIHELEEWQFNWERNGRLPVDIEQNNQIERLKDELKDIEEKIEDLENDLKREISKGYVLQPQIDGIHTLPPPETRR